MAKQKKLAYNKKYGKFVRQLDSGEFAMGGNPPGYGGMGSTGGGSFGGGGGIDPFGGYLTQEIDTMSANPSGQGIGTLRPNYDQIYGGEQQYFYSGTSADGTPFTKIITQQEYDSLSWAQKANSQVTPIDNSFQNYQNARAAQAQRTNEFAAGFVSPQGALARQEYYNQQAQQGPQKDWTTYPKESDYDTNGDGQMSKDERKRLDEARAEWQKNPPLKDNAGATDTSSFQGQPLPGTEEPVQESGQDKDSFLQRLLDWLLRSGGGQRPGVGIQIPLPGFPGFPGGGGIGFPLPFPLPGGGGTGGTGGTGTGGTGGTGTGTGGGTQPPSSPGTGGGTTQPPSTGGGGGGTTQPPVGGGGETGPIDDSREEDDGVIITLPPGGGDTTPPVEPTPPAPPPSSGGGEDPGPIDDSREEDDEVVITLPPGGGDTTQPPVEPTPPAPPPSSGGGEGDEQGPINDTRPGDDDGTIVIVPGWPEGSGGSGSGGNTGGGTNTGGTNVSGSDDIAALRSAASQGAIKVYQDPYTFDRFAPSPLQTMDPRYRNISSFLPSGEITPYAMNYQRTPGTIYANYPDAPRTQGGPLTTYAPRPTTGGGTTQPGTTQPGTTQPGTTQPGTQPPADDNYEDNLREYYESRNPYPVPQSTAGVNAARAKIIERQNEAAIEEWEKGFDEFKAQINASVSRMGLGSIYLGDSIGFAQGGIAAYADGGNVDYFPRRNGQIEGPGTETSDDIPAMLSDGEFVVNAKAVRGIGALQGADNDREDQRLKGARAMYALQRMGEKAAGMR